MPSLVTPVRIALILLLLGLSQAAALTAESAAPTMADARIQPTVSAEQIEAKLAALADDQDLAEESRQRLSERYRKILTHLEALYRFQAQAEGYVQALEQAPIKTAALRAELAELKATSDPPVSLEADTTVAEIEQMLAREQAEAASLAAQLSKLNTTLSEQSEQLVRARRRLTEAPLELAEIDQQLAQPRPEGQSEQARQSVVWALETERDALRAETLMLDQQILSADARRQLAEAERDQLAAQQERLRERRAYLEDEADRLRGIEAEQARATTETTERELTDADPLLLELARRNREISDTISTLTAALGQVDEEQAELEQSLREAQERLKDARARIEAAGLSQAVGQIMVDDRAELPTASSLREQAERRATQIAELTLGQLRLRNELRALADPEDRVEALLAERGSAEPDRPEPDRPEPDRAEGSATPATEEAQRLRGPLQRLLVQQRHLLQQALRLQDSYQRALGDLDFSAKQYSDLISRYRDFLAEHLLWIRNAAPVTEQSFTGLPRALGWLLIPSHWAAVLDNLWQGLKRSPLPWLAGLLTIGFFSTRARLLRRIRGYAEPLRRVSTDRFEYTLAALGLTLIAALPWPLLSALLGWQLSLGNPSTGFTIALGEGLLRIAPPLYHLQALHLLCMPGGVAERHFRWSSTTLADLRRALQIASLVLIPIGLVGEVITRAQQPAFQGTLERLILIIVCLSLAALTAWLLHPRKGLFKALLAERPEGWLYRTRLIWYPLLILIPTVLALIALGGYLYTASTLIESLAAQIWLAFALVILHQLITRWLVLTRRRLSLDAALERRAQREAQRDAREQGAAWVEPSDETVDLAAVDLAALDQQSRKLLSSSISMIAAIGLWLI
jgi:potassium efflux system protein